MTYLEVFIIGILFGSIITILVYKFSYKFSYKCESNKKNITKNISDIKKISDILLHQSARWLIASENDTSPLISVLHANYGASYLWALKDIIGNYKPTNVDMEKFEERVHYIQNKATKKMMDSCPQYAGDLDKYLVDIAEGN